LDGKTTAEICANISLPYTLIKKVEAIIETPSNPQMPDYLSNSKSTRLELNYNSISSQYNALYDGFTVYGIYRISIYAEKQDGQHIDIQSLTFFQNIGPDVYENDNRMSRSTVIVVNGSTRQHHNFHENSDEDWLKFYGISGKKYTIEFRSLEQNCRPKLQIFGPDILNGKGEYLISSVYDYEDRIGQVCLNVKENESGLYYLKITNTLEQGFGELSGYDIGVFVATGSISGFLGGYIVDQKSNQPIEGANIIVSGNSYVGNTDKVGAYYMAVDIDDYSQQQQVTLEAKCYESQTFSVDIKNLKTTRFDARLSLDFDTCGQVRLDDAIAVLQFLSGFPYVNNPHIKAMIENDNTIGINDVICIFLRLNHME
jgi:hypothetical protein